MSRRLADLLTRARACGVSVTPLRGGVYRLAWGGLEVGPMSYLGALLWLQGFAAGRIALSGSVVESPDFRIASDVGGLTAITPLNERARGWLTRYVDSDPTHWHGGALRVHPSFASQVIETMRAAGYSFTLSA